MKNYKHIAFNIFFSAFLIIVMFFLFNTGIIKNIVGGPFFDVSFTDLKSLYIPWLEYCRLGIDHESCKFMDYGKIFYLTPFNESLKLFYINYLPFITIILFIFTTTFLINPKNKLEYLIVLLAILNPSTLVLIDRFNFDIFIFFILIIIALNRFYFFNWFLFLYCFLIKLYPIVSGFFIFIENKKRNSNFLLILILIFAILAAYFLFVDYFAVNKMYISAGKAGYWHIFGLNTLPKIFKYFGINYILSLLVIYLVFFFTVYKLFRSNLINNLIESENLFTSNWRLFLLGGNILFFSFLVYSNYSQREIFLILLIPQLFLFQFENKKFLNLIIFFLIFRFLFLFIYGPSNINSFYLIDGERYFNHIFIMATTIKGVLDFILISFIGSIVLKINFLILKNFLLNLKLKYNK